LHVTDSAIFVAEYVNVDLFVATDTRMWKLTYDGKEQWARTYDLAPVERPVLGEGDEGSALLAGGRAEDSDLGLEEEDGLVAVVDTSSGDVRWAGSFGYCGRDNIVARAFMVENDVFVLHSVKESPKDSLDWKGVVRRIDADGETVWTGLAPHPERGWDRHLAVMDGAVIVGGVTADQPRKYVLTKMAL
jgi:outer membrane protein assembly factor BamB